MVAVNVQENPKVSVVGKSNAEATIITTGLPWMPSWLGLTVITYHIRSMDAQHNFRLSSHMDIANHPQILSISRTQLKIILPSRQWYKVRIKNGSQDWTRWVNFKTRDKTYVTPVAIYTANADFDDNPKKRGNKEIKVKTVGKSTIRTNVTGRHPGCPVVYNTDTQYNGTTSITYTRRGATVITNNFESQALG